MDVFGRWMCMVDVLRLSVTAEAPYGFADRGVFYAVWVRLILKHLLFGLALTAHVDWEAASQALCKHARLRVAAPAACCNSLMAASTACRRCYSG